MPPQTKKNARKDREAPPFELPHKTDVERLVLGSILLHPDSLTEVMDILSPEVFYDGRHAVIYEAMVELSNDNLRIDLPMLEARLQRKGRLEEVGGVDYLMQLMEPVAATINLFSHASLLVETHILRRLILMAHQTLSEARQQQTDTFELLNRTEQSLFEIMERLFHSNYLPLREVIGEFQEQLEEAIQRFQQDQQGLTGVPSGFPEIDELTGGWQKTDLIVVAARPGMGKTSFMLSMARNAAFVYKMPVAIFSLEMGRLQIVGRLISMESKVEISKLRTGNLTPDELERVRAAMQTLEEVPMFIDDTPALDPFELRAKARRLVAHHKIKLIMVDYLQLMQLQGQRRPSFNREQEISTISRTLKSIAKELEVPVIALSQLNREVERRGDKRPILADLRESGAIEQDADMVLFIHRPATAGVAPPDLSPDQAKGYTEIIVAKNRHGKTADIKLFFVDRFATFERWNAVSTAPAAPDGDYQYRASRLSGPAVDASADDTPLDDGDPPF